VESVRGIASVKPNLLIRALTRSRFRGSLGIALTAAVLLWACSGGDGSRLVPGQVFPALALTGLSGGSLDTASLKGRVLVLNVWATWCPPCRREMPSLQRLSESTDRSHIVVVGLTVDRDSQLAREFVLQSRITFPNFVDADMKIANGSLGVVGFPETFVVGTDGKLAARVAGARDWDAPDTVRTLEALSRGERAGLN
jgi:thiol-disulfide isomerase/thioredoxin